MSNQEESSAKVLENRILLAIQEFETNTDIFVTQISRSFVWDYDPIEKRRRAITTGIDMKFETSSGG